MNGGIFVDKGIILTSVNCIMWRRTFPLMLI